MASVASKTLYTLARRNAPDEVDVNTPEQDAGALALLVQAALKFGPGVETFESVEAANAAVLPARQDGNLQVITITINVEE